MKTENKPENPEAFPGSAGQYGMTLRDYFANSVMQGLLSNPTFQAKLPNESESVSLLVFKIADAMLKAREL